MLLRKKTTSKEYLHTFHFYIEQYFPKCLLPLILVFIRSKTLFCLFKNKRWLPRKRVFLSDESHRWSRNLSMRWAKQPTRPRTWSEDRRLAVDPRYKVGICWASKNWTSLWASHIFFYTFRHSQEERCLKSLFYSCNDMICWSYF